MKNATLRLILCAFVTLELFSAPAYAAGKASPANEQATKLEFSDQTGDYGGTLTLSATLTTSGSDQHPVEGANIVFLFNETTYGGITNSSGVATADVRLSDLNAGTYTKFITASFSGIADSYKSCYKTANLIIRQAPTAITVANLQAFAENTVTLTATLNAGSISLSGKQIFFSVNGVPKGSATTDGYGTAALGGVSVSDLQAGDYQISASFSPSGGNYAASSGAGTLTIKELPTALAIIPASGTEGVYGGSVTLQARLTSSGSGLSGKTINFTYNSSTYTAVTTTDGLASVSGVSIAGTDAGTYRKVISASFSASGGYAQASATGDLKITKASTSLSAANAAGDYGGTTSLSATLTSGGRAASEQTIIFSLNGRQAGQAVTGIDGKATLTDVPLSGINTNTYTGAVTASFAGSKNYTGSSAAANLTVNKAATALNVLTSTGTYGGFTSLSAALTSGGKALGGMNVSFSFHGASYSGTTDDSGLVKINNVSLSGIDANTYNNYFTAGFDGNDNFKASTGNGNLSVKQASTSLKVDDQQGPLNGSLALTATLTSSSAGLPEASISFKVNGVSKGSTLTDAGGKATLNNVSLTGLSAGSYIIEAAFSPSGGNYAPVTGTGTLRITELPTEISVTPVTGHYGENVTLEAKLTSSGFALAGKTIAFTVNNSVSSAATGSDGVARLSFSLAGMNAGTYPVKADFFSAEGYNAASDTSTLTIDPAAAYLSVPEVKGTFGGSADLRAVLSSGNGAVEGQEIFFELSGVPAGHAATDAAGVAKLQGIKIPENAGPHPGAVKATFAGSTNYLAAENYGNLTVNPAATKIEVFNSSGPYGGKTSLSAQLTDSSSKSPVSGAGLYFKIAGADMGNGLTDAEGKVTIINAGLPLLDVNTYADYIEVTFSSSGGNYTSSTGKGRLEITPAQTILTVDTLDASYGSTVTLSAKLISGVTQATIAEKNVDFSIDGVPKGSAATNSNGVAALSINPGAGVGKHTVKASFTALQGDNYYSVSNTADLIITELPTELSVSPADGTYGGTVNLEATLTSSGSPAPGRTIVFTFNGKQLSALTNPSGIASVPGVSISGIIAGIHTGAIAAEFAASEGYAAASASGDLRVGAASTELRVLDASGTFGETLSLSATLTSGGTGLNGRSVSFKLGTVSAGSTKTDDHGTASITGVSLSGYDAGSYPGEITAEFTGEDNFTSGSGFGKLTVVQAPVALTAGNVTGTYGATVSLTATLGIASSGSTISSQKISGQKISFRLNGNPVGEASTADGLAALNDVSLGNIPAGLYPGKIEAIYSPSGGNYEAGTDTSWLQVIPANATLVLNKVVSPYGSTATLKAVLSSGNVPLSGRTISFSLNGELKGTAATGSDGVALLEVSLAGIGIGTYTNYIGAGFTPTADNYSGSTATSDLTVYELPSTLSVKNVTGTFGGTVNIEAALASSGEPLSGKIIGFTVNGTYAGAATTGQDGKASFPFSLSGFEAGSYPGKIKADFAASDGYSAASGVGDLTVQQASTLLMVSEVTGTFGGVVDLTATLTSGEAPLARRTISFRLNGKVAGTAATNANGTAVLENASLSGINAGTYKDIITAEFQAEKDYSHSAGLGKMTVNQAPVNILVGKAAGPYNGKAVLTATVTDKASGSPLSGMILSFKLNNVFLGSALTEADGAAAFPGVSLAGLAVGTYNDCIEAGFSPSGGNYAAGTGKGQLEVVPAPANLALSKVTAVYGSKVTLTAALTSSGLPLSGRTVEFTLNNLSLGTVITDTNGLASKPGVDLTGIGTGLHQACIGAGFIGDDSYKGNINTADLEITRASTAVTVLPAEVQYSDQVTLTAAVTSHSAQGSLNTSGGSVEFKYQLGNGAVTYLGSVSSSGVVNGSLNFSHTFNCMLDPKTYKILVSFTPADQANFDGSTNINPWGPLTVEREDALTEYTGLTYFSTATPTSISAAMALSAAINDIADDFRGDISKARVEFSEVPVGGSFDKGIVRGTNPGISLPVFLVNPADPSLGTSSTQPFSRNLNQSELNNLGATFNVYTKVRGYYSKLSDPALITIGIPGSDNISGGGFIVSNHSAGKYRSNAGAKTNFGFTMKYNKSGKINQGQAGIIIFGGDDKVYQVKSSAFSSMSVYSIKGSPGKAASFDAKAILTDITDPFNPILLNGSLLLKVEMYDDGENNENDAVAITLQDSDSGLLYSSSWNGSKTVLQTLGGAEGGGTIRVLSSSGLAKGVAEETVPKEYALYQNFPNPFNPSTNIQFDLPEDSRVKIVIYNILGREVAALINDELPAGKHQAVWNSQDGGGSFASGVYILRITAKSLMSRRNLISTKKMMLVK